jgi:Ribosomal protein L3
VEDVEGAILGSEIQVAEIFATGDMVDVTGVSKGKGWAGGVKRWGFHGGPRTHGQSDRERAPGSIGQTTTPGRVYRGKKMAGRMGSDTVTVKNLEIIEITNDGVLLIKGLVPGRLNGLLMIKKVGENKKFVPLYKEVVEEEVVEAPAEEKIAESSSVSDDAKQSAEEVATSETASLSDSSAPVSEKAEESSEKQTINSSEAGQTSVVQSEEETTVEKEETK